MGVKVVTKFGDFLDGLEKKCLLQAPFCGLEDCEDEIKELSKKDSDLEPNAHQWEPRVCAFLSTSLPRWRTAPSASSQGAPGSHCFTPCLDVATRIYSVLCQ